MAPNLGFASLILNLSIALFGAFFYFLYRHKYQEKNFVKIYLVLIILNLICAISSQLFLIYSFVISDYSVVNVYQNSHHLKPLLYKIAGSWGNHEGSMLLLISVLCFYNFMFALISRLSNNVKISTLATQQLIIALFILYTAITSNPFLQEFPAPKNGLGLNPILQDIGLALHPPMLYLGYLGFSLVFAITVGALLVKNFNYAVLLSIRFVTHFSFITLTFGIALGSWWAYRELGWGGYWFWDPVENISLMPWIASIALIHSLKISKSNELMKSWSIFLAIITLILCLLGIFLTRSGVLTSVHSFAISANRGFFIIALISIIGGYGLYILARNLEFNNKNSIKIEDANSLDANSFFKIIKNRHLFFIIINNYFLITALLVVLIGTIYPIISRGLFDKFISIGASYYNQVFNILLIPFLIFFIANSLKYKNLIGPANIIILSLVISVLISIHSHYPDIKLLSLFNLFLAFYALLINFYFDHKIVAKLVHCGFITIIIGIIFSSSGGKIREVNLQPKQNVEIDDFKIKFDRIDYGAYKNFISRIGVFNVFTVSNKVITTLSPELRFYPVSNQTTNESAIYHHLLYDLYIVIGAKDEFDNYAVRVYFKPFISLIWFGIIMIFFGILIRILKIRKYTLENASENFFLFIIRGIFEGIFS